MGLVYTSAGPDPVFIYNSDILFTMMFFFFLALPCIFKNIAKNILITEVFGILKFCPCGECLTCFTLVQALLNESKSDPALHTQLSDEPPTPVSSRVPLNPSLPEFCPQDLYPSCLVLHSLGLCFSFHLPSWYMPEAVYPSQSSHFGSMGFLSGQNPAMGRS